MARRRARMVDPLEPVIDPPAPVEQQQERWTDNDTNLLRKLLAEQQHRDSETLRLFRPLPRGEEFHACKKRNRLALGGNRSSKTTTAAVEFSRAITGQDPHRKFPKKNGVAFVFGKDERHIGSVIYKKVFQAGCIDMVKDPVTKRWRAFHPVDDADIEHLKKPAPPLVPRRFIKTIAWAQKKLNVPKMMVMKNGWEIHFFSTLAELPQGQAIDLWWIDEEARRENIVAEMLARSIDRHGRGMWSATPQQGSNQLFDLHEQRGGLDVEAFHFHIKDNPYFNEEKKEAFWRQLTEEQRRVRWDGEFLLSGFSVYPEFSKIVHAWPETLGWQVPRDWCHYMSVDPGRQICAVLFLAVPPPWMGKFVVVHDELYIEKCDANKFGMLTARKAGQRVFETALIDGQMGKVSDMGSGKNIEAQYRNALVHHGFQMRNTVNFTWGANDIQAGLSAVRDWMRIGANGKPYLYVNLMACPNLCNEFRLYRYKPRPDMPEVPTEKPHEKNNHLMDCLRYLAMYGPQWRKPKPREVASSPAYEAFLRKKKHAADKSKAGGVDRPGISLGMGRG